jgi:hypothetical protein
MQPVVCNKDMAVVFPLKDGDCEFWLEIVDSVDDITNPSRDHAYVDSKGLFYIYNGKEIQVINDHANLKIKWGNMIGDISNQLDLMEILNQFVKTISVNGTNIAKDNDKNIAIQVPITTIKLDGNTISPVDYIVNLDLASVYAKKTEIPKNVSELQNDAGYIKQEVVDQLIPIKAIKVNNVTIPPDENRTVNIENVYVTPEEFGAIGDGTTNDSSAFNTCFAKAMETGKYVLLSNKTYVIESKLNDIIAVNIIGIHSQIKLLDNEFCDTLSGCYVYGVRFYRDTYGFSNKKFVRELCNTTFNYCVFDDLYIMFETLIGSRETTLLKNCQFINTNLFHGTGNYNSKMYLFDNTSFYYDENGSHGENMINGSLGYGFVFNNCIIQVTRNDSTQRIFTTNDNLTFNNCYIFVLSKATCLISVEDDNEAAPMTVIFNNCKISNLTSKTILKVSSSVSNMYFNLNIINSELSVKSICDSNLECSLWLENNIMDTKPIINSGTGKVNLVEIQQKYSDTSENIFPWTTEPTPTVENNVSLIEDGTDHYYVLTESKDKNVKKLDYYFKYDVDYLVDAPYYSNSIFVRDLDLEGYTVKRSYLSDNTCKLKNKSTGELIDYVYFMLDDNVTVTTSKDDPQLTYTRITIKYLPYFAKLKTDTPVAGQLHVDMCISIILEKTSS